MIKKSLFEWLEEQNLHLAFGYVNDTGNEDHADFDWLGEEEVTEIEREWAKYLQEIYIDHKMGEIVRTKLFVKGVQDGTRRK
jgi:hypothetical protein